jgi:hypothetical protein
MCMQCMATAMGSIAAASGTRAWLGTRRFDWLTQARLRKVTVALFTAALIASALLMSGSSRAPAGHQPDTPAAHAAR